MQFYEPISQIGLRTKPTNLTAYLFPGSDSLPPKKQRTIAVETPTALVLYAARLFAVTEETVTLRYFVPLLFLIYL